MAMHSTSCLKVIMFEPNFRKSTTYRRAHPFNPPRSLLTYPQNFAKKVSNSIMVKDIDIVISHEYKPYTLNYLIKAGYLKINFCVICNNNATPKFIYNTKHGTYKIFRAPFGSKYLLIRL